MGNGESAPPLFHGTDYDPAGYLPPGLYDTTQIWDAQGVTAKACNNSVFTRALPAIFYDDYFSSGPYDYHKYPCAWDRQVPYNHWVNATKWVNPPKGTILGRGGNPVVVCDPECHFVDKSLHWGEPNWKFCVLDAADGVSKGSKNVAPGDYGEVYPRCFANISKEYFRDRPYMESVEDAMHQFRVGSLDAVSEINSNDPYNRDPCGGRDSLAMLLPWVLTVVSGVGTSILLRYVVFVDVPPVSLTALSVGAAGFGWNFGQALQAKGRDREYYVNNASSILSVGIGAGVGSLVPFAFADNWQQYELAALAAGGALGYFYLKPVLEPGLGASGGLLGSVLGFLSTIVGGIENIVCGISNWNIDGCSPDVNWNARSWDRVLLAAAAADSLAASHDLDPKQKEVAFQAMLVNAANVNAYTSPTDKIETLVDFNPARAWNVGLAPPNTPEGKPTNGFASLGSTVQPEMVAMDKNEAAAFFAAVFDGKERNNKYMQTMFEPTLGALLQKCDRFSEIEHLPQFSNWMDKAYIAAQNGKTAPTRVIPSLKTYNCKDIYLEFLQCATWEAGVEYLWLWEKDTNKGGTDFLFACKETEPELYYALYAIASAKGEKTAAQLVEQINSYILAIPLKDRIAALYQLLLSSLEQWHISSAIANDPEATSIWRKWVRLAEGGVVTACEAAVDEIESGDDNWRALGAKAAKIGQNVDGCTQFEQGKLDTYKLFDNTTSCSNAVSYTKFQMQNVPRDTQYKCGVGLAFSKADGFNCGAEAQNQVDEWVAACSQ